MSVPMSESLLMASFDGSWYAWLVQVEHRVMSTVTAHWTGLLQVYYHLELCRQKDRK